MRRVLRPELWSGLEQSCMEGRMRSRKQNSNGNMIAPQARYCAGALLYLLIVLHVASATPEKNNNSPIRDERDLPTKKIELFDGVSVNIPKDANSTEKLMSFEIDTERSLEEGRGRKGSKGNKKLMERILPMFIMPFLIQSTIVPFFLSMLKFMLFKSLMVGKLALALILLNAFKNHNTVKGRDAEMADVHYGYSDSGMEYGAYFN